MNIYGISALAGSGKDSVADALESKGFQKVALADPMKRFCAEVFDWSPDLLWGASELRSTEDHRYLQRTRSTITEIEDARIFDVIDGQEDENKDYSKVFLTPRYALQTLGTEWGRDCYQDIWVDYAMRVAKRLLENGYTRYTAEQGIYTKPASMQLPVRRAGVVITDVRFKNEILALKERGGKIIRIKRPGYEKPKWNHPSETEQMDIPDKAFDYIFHNDGTLEDIPAKVQIMIDVLDNSNQG
jgi:hypothetical protein